MSCKHDKILEISHEVLEDAEISDLEIKVKATEDDAKKLKEDLDAVIRDIKDLKDREI